MLEPQDRRLFLDSLRPPAGYTLDLAVGTTYSLDLLSLVTVPLAFAFFGYEDSDGKPTADPLALLEAVRRYADSTCLFCQAGEIRIPKQYRTLLAYLEGSVIEVAPRSLQHVFHPKVWVLRFSGEGLPVLYRLLVLSRNLTFDRSWDTMLVLEGELDRWGSVSDRNEPLAAFLGALPGLAVRPLPDRVGTQIGQVQSEIRHVAFELPDGFDGVAFWPLGLSGGPEWPFQPGIERMLVISPFVSEGTLRRLTQRGDGHVLVSRIESLAQVSPHSLRQFASVRVLDEAANPEPSGEEQQDEAKGPAGGLHAKVYVADAGQRGHLWVGSANATDPAFGGNVEFLVELQGTRAQCGVDAVLGHGRRGPSFGSLLKEYAVDVEVWAVDPGLSEAEVLLRVANQAVARAPLLVRATSAGHEVYHLELWHTGPDLWRLPPGVEVRCWPLTLKDHEATPLPSALEDSKGPHLLAVFGPVSIPAITSFFGFALRVSDGRRTLMDRFALNLPLEGAPENRRQHILRQLLDSREAVLRYLLFLLADDPSVAGHELLAAWPTRDGESAASPAGTPFAFPLLEAMVRALHRNPRKLDSVARVVEDLRSTPQGRQLLPEGFEAVWDAVWAVHQDMKG